jgi:hypothetical protein
MYVFLKRPEFVKYTSELGSVSPRILLTGPPGMCLHLMNKTVMFLLKSVLVPLMIATQDSNGFEMHFSCWFQANFRTREGFVTSWNSQRFSILVDVWSYLSLLHVVDLYETCDPYRIRNLPGDLGEGFGTWTASQYACVWQCKNLFGGYPSMTSLCFPIYVPFLELSAMLELLIRLS